MNLRDFQTLTARVTLAAPLGRLVPAGNWQGRIAAPPPAKPDLALQAD